MKHLYFSLFMVLALSAFNIYAEESPMAESIDWTNLTEEEWKERLSEEEFYILRQKGTERAFTGKYHDHKEEGTYTCAGCALPLFSSDHKYDSGTGWPSYWEVIDKNNIEEKEDRSWFSVRTEVVCSRCKGHLGHVFPDGPQPTGLRYCINSAALDFVSR